jgi:hypothetical protein
VKKICPGTSIPSGNKDEAKQRTICPASRFPTETLDLQQRRPASTGQAEEGPGRLDISGNHAREMASSSTKAAFTDFLSAEPKHSGMVHQSSANPNLLSKYSQLKLPQFV